MIVELIKDDPRFKLKAGERFEAITADYDPQKVILISRLSDGFKPECSQYKHNAKKIKTS
jgi:hypothetical protein